MTDIEWPKGATHRVEGCFKKWVNEVEFDFDSVKGVWSKSNPNWPLSKYLENGGFEIIEGPKGPVINWDEQPTPEHCWAEDLNDDKNPDFEGWCKECDNGSWRMDNAFSVWAHDAESEGNVRIHRKPEPEPYKPEVGEWFIASGGAKMAFVGVGSGNSYICEMDDGGLLRLYDFAGCHPIKSEREQFIERAMKATNGDNSDSTLIDLFDDMYQDGFEAPKDNGARFEK